MGYIRNNYLSLFLIPHTVDGDSASVCALLSTPPNICMWPMWPNGFELKECAEYVMIQLVWAKSETKTIRNSMGILLLEISIEDIQRLKKMRAWKRYEHLYIPNSHIDPLKPTNYPITTIIIVLLLLLNRLLWEFILYRWKWGMRYDVWVWVMILAAVWHKLNN